MADPTDIIKLFLTHPIEAVALGSGAIAVAVGGFWFKRHNDSAPVKHVTPTIFWIAIAGTVVPVGWLVTHPAPPDPPAARSTPPPVAAAATPALVEPAPAPAVFAPPPKSTADMLAEDTDILKGQQAEKGGNYKAALRWYLKATVPPLASGPAENAIGDLYANGRGVPVDYERALHWYGEAAKHGSEDAEVNIGYLHYLGRGLPQDPTAAMKWFVTAAKQGSPSGEFATGLLLANGYGVPQDVPSAHAWIKKAADQHFPLATNCVAHPARCFPSSS